MKAMALALAGLLAIEGTARAEDEPGAPGKIAIAASATIWLPQADAADFADVSIGLRPEFTYWIIPLVGVTAAFDYTFVNEESGAGDITYWSLAAGGRITIPRQMRIKPYGEILIGYHSVDADGFDESDIGFRFGGGVTYGFGGRLFAQVGLAYSTASLDAIIGDVDVNAFVLAFGVGGQF